MSALCDFTEQARVAAVDRVLVAFGEPATARCLAADLDGLVADIGRQPPPARRQLAALLALREPWSGAPNAFRSPRTNRTGSL